jgi:hypothetical protein
MKAPPIIDAVRHWVKKNKLTIAASNKQQAIKNIKS